MKSLLKDHGMSRVFSILYLLSSIIILAGLLSPGYAQGLNSNTQPDILDEVGIEQKLNEEIPLDLIFRDEEGQRVPLNGYFRGKPVILALVYYECPMLCTMILNGLLKSLNTLQFEVGKEFDIVTVSFDPDETPVIAAGKKKTYITKYGRDGAADGWHFLTGEEAAIKRLTEAAGFKYKYNPETDEYVHASGIMVLTPQGKLSRYFYGIEYSPRDLKFGLIEASDNKIGSPVDQILLYCYHYDPTTGQYGVVIMNIIRIIGSLTVIALVSFMLIQFHRDRRSKRQVSTI